MDESIKIEELFRTYPSSDTDDSIVTFLEDFDAYLKKMKIPQTKKQLIMNKEDVKPCILNINS
ncbi:MAG: hypothetical protein EGS41_11985 [Prevotella sp.]|nr:hypothetical protein [Prevotella sp.]